MRSVLITDYQAIKGQGAQGTLPGDVIGLVFYHCAAGWTHSRDMFAHGQVEELKRYLDTDPAAAPRRWSACRFLQLQLSGN
jgi:hypothetical protein